MSFENSLHRKQERLLDNLERFRHIMSLNMEEWSDRLGVSATHYQEILLKKRDLSVVALARLCDEVSLSLDSFMEEGEKKIDFQALQSSFEKGSFKIPEKYLIAAQSRRWSSINYLKYIEEFMGWRVRMHALRTLQVPESAFSQPNEKINVRFITDLFDFLATHYSAQGHFYFMGAYSVVTYQDSAIGKMLIDSRSVAELYEHLFTDLIPKHLENNCSYQLMKLNKSSCRIVAIEKPGLAAELGMKKLGSSLFCMTKVGLTASVPGYLGLPFGDAHESSCIHNGDSRCVYEVDFERAEHLLKQPQTP